jgi:hypothetical protein
MAEAERVIAWLPIIPSSAAKLMTSTVQIAGE